MKVWLWSTGGVKYERNSPHPVLLPMGEGTPEFRLRVIQGSPLPWGEGQGEGRESWSGRDRATGDALSPSSLSGGRLAP